MPDTNPSAGRFDHLADDERYSADQRRGFFLAGQLPPLTPQALRVVAHLARVVDARRLADEAVGAGPATVEPAEPDAE